MLNVSYSLLFVIWEILAHKLFIILARSVTSGVRLIYEVKSAEFYMKYSLNLVNSLKYVN